jgi:hypothetical protein
VAAGSALARGRSHRRRSPTRSSLSGSRRVVVGYRPRSARFRARDAARSVSNGRNEARDEEHVSAAAMEESISSTAARVSHIGRRQRRSLVEARGLRVTLGGTGRGGEPGGLPMDPKERTSSIEPSGPSPLELSETNTSYHLIMEESSPLRSTRRRRRWRLSAGQRLTSTVSLIGSSP